MPSGICLGLNFHWDFKAEEGFVVFIKELPAAEDLNGWVEVLDGDGHVVDQGLTHLHGAVAWAQG